MQEKGEGDRPGLPARVSTTILDFQLAKKSTA
jgi:hypothetical protein